MDKLKFALVLLLSIGFHYVESTEVKEALHVNNKYFYYDPIDDGIKDVSWDDALAFCNRNNMNLATIKNKEENDAVFKFLKDTYHSSAFLGGSDKLSEGKWYWHHNKSPIKFTNWGAGQPEEGEYSSCMKISANDGTWGASYCDAAYARPLCEEIRSS